jgi:hypothetical protein
MWWVYECMHGQCSNARRACLHSKARKPSPSTVVTLTSTQAGRHTLPTTEIPSHVGHDGHVHCVVGAGLGSLLRVALVIMVATMAGVCAADGGAINREADVEGDHASASVSSVWLGENDRLGVIAIPKVSCLVGDAGY